MFDLIIDKYSVRLPVTLQGDFAGWGFPLFPEFWVNGEVFSW